MKKINFLSSMVFICTMLIPSILFAQSTRMPLIGEEAPAFTANSTMGEINFPDDYYGKWKVLFSHPADFTPVCTSEMLSFALMFDEIKALNCQLVGLSVDGLNSHLEWVASMESIPYKGEVDIKINYPIVSDIQLDIARSYGMVHPERSDLATVRTVFIIDPDDIVRTILYYPMEIGRSIPEIKRVLQALQTVDRYNVVTPADWQPGDDVLVQTPRTADKAKKAMQPTEKMNCLSWYFCFKKL